ncbi:Spy/CpxP family protein refolding chaperone [Polyangium jinanense]|uniref:Spy/CpxP family protein refolding chaperone n=1 Tax=Polyangium jinanense TaxID=2829994 RepID=A0A9X3X0T6_9BACT|nr:Spy/CpxP family protein refolding chaperone [Polyangium jinanense]MDC3954027.1 Spy/CpxP family protein refolding chaperone [Polyangium jinanense]MDC3982017.1 Spy/CpxP family protein refolding chaperone [Polyangium jinanense]
MFTRTQKFFAPLTFALALALGGCASASPDEEVASASEASQEAQAAPHERGGKFGRHHGGGELLVTALHELDLTDAQRKTIEGALSTLGDAHEADRKAFHKALADGVRAGKIDEAAVKAKLGDGEKIANERRAAVAKALNTLHATLTPAQRAELVAHVEERMAKHGPEGMKHARGPRGPEDGERGPRGPEGAMRGPRGEHGPMGFFLHGLDLRDEQRAQIKSALEASRPEKPEGMDREAWAKKHEEMRTRMKAGLDAFRSEKFDAEALLPSKEMRPEMGDHLVKALSAIVPVLDAEQRSTLAQRIEEGPQMPPHFRGKHGGREHGETQAPPSR